MFLFREKEKWRGKDCRAEGGWGERSLQEGVRGSGVGKSWAWQWVSGDWGQGGSRKLVEGVAISAVPLMGALMWCEGDGLGVRPRRRSGPVCGHS